MLTLGHSTLPLETFLDVLQRNDISTLVDVRTIPRSRHNPQFSQENMELSLPQVGIAYLWKKDLGGLRPIKKNSSNMASNMAWRNASFRGYADYMQTPEFTAALAALIQIGQSCQPRQCVILCAEAVPWRCHRSLIGDALLANGVAVEDIFVQKNGTSMRKPHHMTPFAHLDGAHVFYPAEQQALALE